MEIIQWIIIFIISLGALVKFADYFTNAAEKIGLHLKISPFIIGITIVALGTSLPEIATSVSAVLKDQSEIVIGNVIGSNIANMLLVLGFSAIFAGKMLIKKDIIKVDLPILMGATIILYLSTADGLFTFGEGIISLLALAIYLIYTAKSEPKNVQKEVEAITKKDLKKDSFDWWQPLILVLSSAGIYFGAEYTIKSISELATTFNVSAELIAVSAVAIGTSLPELVVSVAAAKKGKGDMAIGNITGSNIFNALGVMGIPALIKPLEISPDTISFTIPALVFITILYIFETMEKEITKWEGAILLLIYLVFMGKLFAFL